MREWQPIATAPRAGESLLVARFVGMKRGEEVWVFHVAWFDRRTQAWSTVVDKTIETPTYWRHLPSSPHATEETGT